MDKKIPHPLKAWLAEHGLSVVQFARVHRLKWRALYNHIDGVPEIPRPKTMRAIQRATGGDVTMQAQIEWFNARLK